MSCPLNFPSVYLGNGGAQISVTSLEKNPETENKTRGFTFTLVLLRLSINNCNFIVGQALLQLHVSD